MAQCCKTPLPGLWPFMIELWAVARNLVILFLLYNLIKLVYIRSKFWRLKKQGVPLMPYSLLVGHILVLLKLLAGLPKDLHPNYVPQIIYQNWRSLFPSRSSCPSVIYVDTWPVGPPTIFIVDPEMAAQCIADPDVKRSHHTKEYLLPLTDNLDLVSMEGGLWKAWRSRLNPAFSPKNVQSLVPAIIHDVQIFAQVIRRQVGENGSWGPVLQLQELATNLTIDVSGRAALGMELNEQTNGPSHFKAALMDQTRSCMFRFSIIDRIRHYDLRRSWAVARNRVEMNAKIFQAVIQCLNHKDNDDCKTIIGQSMKLVRDSVDEKMASPLDPLFVQTVISQVKAFMFGGLDSTATTICSVLHVLAKNPEIAKRVRNEHKRNLGKDISSLRAVLEKSPHLLSSLTCTAGVIMETLRLYPVIGPLRDGSSRYEFVDREIGVSCPTDGCLVVDAVRALATAEEIWPRAAEVIPERWMTTDPSDPLYPPKHAWRMFGHGPRVCIGQELALTEVKLVIVFLVREFDLDCAWEKWDAMRIRRVKCDEARPSCNRCIATGRKCDGYITPPPGVYTWTALLRANPPSQQTVAEPELRALSFFRTVVAPVLAGPLDDSFWTQLVNQVSHQEKAAKHAVLTISSLYEKFKENPMDRLAGEKNLFAVTNYNQAIRYLRTTDNQETVLLVCILFVCIDMLRGECKGAIDHCRHGINILNSVHHKSAFIRDHLEPAFCRLGVFPFFFGVRPESFPVIETETVVPKAPFRSVAELQAGLNPLLVQTIRFVRSADAYRLADDRMPKPGPATMQKRVDIDAALDAWEVGFRRWKDKRHAKKASRPDIVEHILEMKWLVGKIWIDTCMSRGETIFDLHMGKFQRIIDVARDAERIVRIPRQNKRRAKFTFEMGFSPLLGFVVVKCRSLSLRVAARELMKTLAHEREHLWDNNTMLAIGRTLRRVRRAVKGFPPESVADFLVSVCITYGTDIFFYFDQTHFVSELRSFYSDTTSKLRTDTAFVCLALAVFALGSHWTSLAKPDGANSENLPEDIDPGRVFYNQARILIADIINRPSLQSVQAAFVLGVYLMPASAISASYVYMGLALRKALAIGLHLEPDDPGLGEEERETRRRLWWSIYSLERTVTIKLNRPRSISQDIITARMPQPLPRDKPQKFDNVLHQIANAQLAMHIRDIRDGPDLRARSCAERVKRALPASLKLQNIHPKSLSYRAVFHLHLNYYFSWIDMGKVSVVTVVRARLRTVFCPDERPSEVRPSIEKSSEACIKAAKKMLELFEGLSKSGNMARFSFTDLQGCSIATIVVLLAGILDRDSGYDGRVAFGLDCLRKMASGGNTTARMGVRFVEALQAITNEARAKLLTVNRKPKIQHPAVSGQTSGYGDWKDWVTNFETMDTSSDSEGEAHLSDSSSPNLGESGVTDVMLPTPWDEAAALQLQEMSAGDFRVPMAAPGDIMDDQGGEALPSADDGWPPLFVGNDDQMYLMGLTGMDVLDFTGGFT
ncbi:putative sterigmatocystin biosynthesis P450 monooxygenase stcS [Colletotrichum spinosum]|uniref:Putative sterigmatocystin biosynthesis P450 monooxygenase stcS n=1 Tax=Colletotrichum spinosum TaxID=1347390 RepID=A0A4R8PVZ7_9PEZI|nr:putative sterigmatocystin biosynthesis P450 monooxygenase stcS [Colletotrichum spinosum]